MPNLWHRSVAAAFGVACVMLGLGASVGCHYSSPFRYQEWEDEARFGATFNDRLAVVRKLASQADRTPSAEREVIAQDLARRITQESNELMRMELVRALGAYKTDSSYQALTLAANDPAPRVRRIACERLGEFRRSEAIGILAEAMRNDPSSDVRMAAARSLGEIGDPRATEVLAIALDDGNPAMQRRAMRSLASVSGQNLGDNVAAWKNYTRNYLGEGQESIASQNRPANVVPAGRNY